MAELLTTRLERLCSVLGQVEVPGLRELTTELSRIGAVQVVSADFRAGKTKVEILNLAQNAIFHVAHLADHLRRWAKSESLDPSLVSTHVSSSRALQIITDLSDRDKHGGTPRDGGKSGLSPELKDVDCALEMGASDTWVSTNVHSGKTVAKGSIVVTGLVVDADGNQIGHLHELLRDAIGEWEELMRTLGLEIPD